ncbi:putative ABC transporter ATP-binding protein YxlF [Planctomycetes bacterium Pan216]|uniref:Putative ABC transporter ATP-binding protein YxlF n=1 Tax=Kolteria novifilia TaxID=2527975 RepID=A0A518BC23_9BACT|nr:putative ABC transporter ATP-binding protein YxlF [Planctomycetes bacterium Pan216]
MSDSPSMAILTESLTKIYHGTRIALSCVDLQVEPGTVLGILGPNGAGKTTLVRLLMGLHVATAGRVYLFGERMGPNAAALRRRIGYVPAQPNFPQSMTAVDYLDFVGRLGGMPRKTRRPALAKLIRAVDLQNLSGQPISRLSTGLLARLSLAASLINDPEILVWDEPSMGLDPDARRTMLELITNLASSKTLLLCSHHVSELKQVCDRAIVLHEGNLIYDGDVESLGGSANPSLVEIALVGDRKTMTAAAKMIDEFDEITRCKFAKGRMSIEIRPDVSYANVLAHVLSVLSDHQLELAELQVGGQQADGSLLELAMEEGSRGLTRAYQSVVD